MKPAALQGSAAERLSLSSVLPRGTKTYGYPKSDAFLRRRAWTLRRAARNLNAPESASVVSARADDIEAQSHVLYLSEQSPAPRDEEVDDDEGY